ncbi:large ribosomal subunit protein uL24m-like [Sycon ciliatum]|uniref:large ribosomal subunit protein uL24m-like n=1 Tax=Sycon ciliatum TaxID=27933 RepID=UPI0031F71C81
MSRFNRLTRFPGTVREGLSRAKALFLEQGNKDPRHDAFFKKLHYRPNDGDFNIFVGDLVHILEGPDKGRTGIVRDIFWQKRWIYITGRNTKLMEHTDKGKTIHYHEEKPLDWHQVALVDHSDNKPCITELSYLEDGTPTRVSTRTGAVVPLPPEVNDPPGMPSTRDTDPKEAAERTYLVSSKTFAEHVLFSPDLKDTIYKRIHEGNDPIYAALKFRREREARKKAE